MDDTRVELSGPNGVIFEGTSDEFSALANKIGSVASVRIGGAAGQLKSLVERIERLNEEAAGLREDIAEIYKEAKSAGFDPAVIRKVVAERKKDGTERQNHLELFNMYWSAVN